MKKILILSALMTALASAGAMAADANVNFTGTVSAATCTLNAADASKTLTIPSVSAGTLFAAGVNGYLTYNASSSFGFTACPAGLTRVTSAYTYQGSLMTGAPEQAMATGTATNMSMIVMQGLTPNLSSIVNADGTSSTRNYATITANAATVPVIVGVNSKNASGTVTLPTMGTYTGTYLVAFTYS